MGVVRLVDLLSADGIWDGVHRRAAAPEGWRLRPDTCTSGPLGTPCAACIVEACEMPEQHDAALVRRAQETTEVSRGSACVVRGHRAESSTVGDLPRSALARALRGDLDWILLKALARERRQRYGSALALAEDVQRHLDHR